MFLLGILIPIAKFLIIKLNNNNNNIIINGILPVTIYNNLLSLFDLSGIVPKEVQNPLQHALNAMKFFEPYPLGNEEMKIRICYPKTEFNKSNTEVYLFNKTISPSLNYVLTRTKNQDNSIHVIISEVDENFITICEKMQMMNFRQIYSLDVNII